MDWLEALQEIDVDLMTSALFLLTTVAGSFAAAAASLRKRLMTGAVHLIGHAEEKFANQETSGADKRAYAVNMLRQLVPKPLRPFFSTQLLEQTIDSAFEAVSGYAKARHGQDKAASFGEDGTPLSDPSEPVPPAASEECAEAKAPDSAELRTIRVFSVQGRSGLLLQVRYGISRRQTPDRGGAGKRENAPIP